MLVFHVIHSQKVSGTVDCYSLPKKAHLQQLRVQNAVVLI